MQRAIVFIILVIFIMQSCRSPKPEDIYSSYKLKETRQLNALLAILSFPNDSTISAEKLNLISILQNYKDNLFESAVSLGQTFYKDIPRNDTADLFYALALMELNKFEETTPILINLCENSQFKFQAEACWYYSLILLRDKTKWDECKALLKKVALLDQREYESKVNALLAVLR
jgi:hypothetical protein